MLPSEHASLSISCYILVALLELCLAPVDVSPLPCTHYHHVWIPTWVPPLQLGMCGCDYSICCAFSIFAVVPTTPGPQQHRHPLNKPTNPQNPQNPSPTPPQCLALITATIAQVPFVLHMPLACVGIALSTLLVVSKDGICGTLCSVAVTSPSCARLLSMLRTLGDTMHEMLWQYSSAMGFVVNKVQLAGKKTLQNTLTPYPLPTHSLAQMPTAQPLQSCALASMALHLFGLAGTSTLLYYRELNMRIAFLNARRGTATMSLELSVQGLTLRWATGLACAAVHVLLLMDALLIL